ncbi:4'-phosphopantetheinyl transferase superfamily protein [Brevibacterium sp. 91QC2O2]|uniref:4'-phosphopantetheinyl transferase family protein n=1 Tax=Brevibacterium sp. 91QC2O2 TaxID=2968458 RepID=UPI00211BD52F|nr:4'-phosphopantetheinyl transferase superfamily protein [Brevibacterium sp. 91QC2O2]MCQ9369266.1 4'-phosphopantetheinyl transferase superfamily protein [Brevibacterium sp. 91QC2O2]
MNGALLRVATAAEVLAELSAPEALDALSEAERDRMERLRLPADRRDFLAAHVLVRLIAAQWLGAGPESPAAPEPGAVEIVQSCAVCGGPHGAPRIKGRPDLQASMSHSRGFVAAAVARVPVGIDVEALAGIEVPAGALHPAEQEVLQAASPAATASYTGPAAAQLWVRKEALVKTGALALEQAGGVDVRDDRCRGARIDDLAAPPGAVAALALLTD